MIHALLIVASIVAQCGLPNECRATIDAARSLAATTQADLATMQAPPSTTPRPTATVAPTATPTPEPSATPTPWPTATAQPVVTVTASATATTVEAAHPVGGGDDWRPMGMHPLVFALLMFGVAGVAVVLLLVTRRATR